MSNTPTTSREEFSQDEVLQVIGEEYKSALSNMSREGISQDTLNMIEVLEKDIVTWDLGNFIEGYVSPIVNGTPVNIYGGSQTFCEDIKKTHIFIGIHKRLGNRGDYKEVLDPVYQFALTVYRASLRRMKVSEESITTSTSKLIPAVETSALKLMPGEK